MHEPEEIHTFRTAKKAVWDAVKPILGDAMLGALVFTVEAAQFAPIPTLAPAAATLLSIWEAVEKVHVCLMSRSNHETHDLV